MNSDTESDPWYREGLAFECTGCGHCCSGPTSGYVWVDDHEILRLAEHLGIDDLELFEHRFVRRVGARKSLVEYSDGDCIFLDPGTRRCIVYSARPVQCRTWPFWPSNLESPKAWGKAASLCPGCNRGRVYGLEEIRLLSRSESSTRSTSDKTGS